MSNVLTFDLGTTYFKVCLFDEELRLVARQRVAVPVENAVATHAELSVTVFEACLTKAVHEVSRQAGGLNSVKRVCFASQGNTFTLLDSSDRVLFPFILWTDQRARGMDSFWRALVEHPAFGAKTGLAQIDHHFMLPKIAWLQKYRPDIVSRARRLCGLGDYLTLWLTGNHLTEAGLAGLTGLIDIHRLQYWNESLRHLELPREWLPQIVRAGTDSGELRQEITAAFGLPADCRLVMGCLDQYAGAIGAGNTEHGHVSETTGTVLATVRCAREFNLVPRPGVFQGPAYAPGLYYQLVFSNVAGGLLEKYRNHLPDRPEFHNLDDLAARVSAGAEGLRLHPNAPNLAPADMFTHRLPTHGRGHEVRAIMEGVAEELRQQVAMLCGQDWPILVRAAGGASQSQLWLQIKSKFLGCPVEAVDCPEPTSLGAARLCGLQAELI